MERQKIQNNKHKIEREDKFGGLTPADFKTYYKAAYQDVVWWRIDKIDQQNRIKTPEIDSETHNP